MPNERIEFRMARDARWKYAEFRDYPPVLFDMLNDPDETTNLLASQSDVSGAPIDQLRKWATAGLDWDEIAAMREEESRRRPHFDWGGPHGPVQYQLRDGRIVEADIFLYPGLSEEL